MSTTAVFVGHATCGVLAKFLSRDESLEAGRRICGSKTLLEKITRPAAVSHSKRAENECHERRPKAATRYLRRALNIFKNFALRGRDMYLSFC